MALASKMGPNPPSPFPTREGGARSSRASWLRTCPTGRAGVGRDANPRDARRCPPLGAPAPPPALSSGDSRCPRTDKTRVRVCVQIAAALASLVSGWRTMGEGGDNPAPLSRRSGGGAGGVGRSMALASKMGLTPHPPSRRGKGARGRRAHHGWVRVRPVGPAWAGMPTRERLEGVHLWERRRPRRPRLRVTHDARRRRQPTPLLRQRGRGRGRGPVRNAPPTAGPNPPSPFPTREGGARSSRASWLRTCPTGRVGVGRDAKPASGSTVSTSGSAGAPAGPVFG